MFKVTLVIGIILSGLGVTLFFAGIGQPSSSAGINAGASLFFSMGLVVMSLGFYLEARKLRPQLPTAQLKSKKTDRLCSVCNQETAQVFCRVHVARLCPGCFEKHDDGKNCLYVPARRAAAAYK